MFVFKRMIVIVFLNPNAWPHSVRISEWFSKRNPVWVAGGEKRISVGSGEHVISEVIAIQHSAIQQPPCPSNKQSHRHPFCLVVMAITASHVQVAMIMMTLS